MNTIKQKVPVMELLAGLAEEASELAQAALKLRRVIDPYISNPTPVTEDQAMERLYEEIADVKLYCSVLDVNVRYISQVMEQKKKRWEDRLMSREASE